jgi:aryl-alcohol dehydrogenase-like predicted oxidoreductase
MMKDMRATTAGTKTFAARQSELTYHELGQTGLFVSEAGFGGYRVSIHMEPHYEALYKSLSNGINLIDTSSNYADGGSEELIGKVLADLIAQGILQRDEVVIVAKAGYLQGTNLAISAEKKRLGVPFSDLVVFNKDLEHCIHPDFLQHQLTQSLERLHLTTIDCFLLHNPEYYFFWAQQQGISQADAQSEFLRRIEVAFRYLETEVQAGRISYYGISSNTFPVAADVYEFSPLEKIWAIAERIDPKNHFRIIELPLNVFETGAATLGNQTAGQTVLEFAQQQGLAVLINRPLNAVCDNKIRRLADLSGPEFDNIELLVTQIKAMMDMEDTFRLTFITQLTDEELSQPDLFKGLACGEVIQKNWYNFDSYWHWQEVKASYFNPIIQHSLDLLTASTSMTLPMKHWIEEYINLLNPLFTNVTNYYRSREMKRIQLDKAMIAGCDADWAFDCSLSQLAIHVLRSTQGVTAILVGMRDESYVSDVLAELARPVSKLPRQASWQCLAGKAAQATIDELSLLPTE